MSRSEQLKDFISNLPVDKAIYKVSISYGNSISFNQLDSAKAPRKRSYSNLEELAETEVRQTLLRDGNDKGTCRFYIDTDNTFKSVMDRVRSDLLSMIKDIYPTKEPKRTSLYKWFYSFKDSGNAYKYNDTFLGLMEYYNRTKDEPSEAHKNNILAILEKIRIKYDRK